MATARWRKIDHRGEFQRTNTKALNLENVFISPRESFSLARGSAPVQDVQGVSLLFLILQPFKYLSIFILSILNGEVSKMNFAHLITLRDHIITEPK